MQGAPIIPASALRPLLNQAKAAGGGGNMVVMMPNNMGGATPRIVSNPAGLPLRTVRPGVSMTSLSASQLSRMAGVNRPGIMRTTASNLKNKISMRKQVLPPPP